MNRPIRYESIQEPLDDEERELMNPDNWDWENPVEAVVAADLIVELPIEVTLEEHRILGQAAREKGMTTHQFIKQSALKAARTESTELAMGSPSRQTRE